MGYNYNFDYYGDAAGSRTEDGWIALIAVYLMIILFSAAIGLVFYLLQSFGLYKMAKTVGLSSPWLAFVPILNTYTLGKVAETPVNGKKTLRYSVILLLCYIAELVVAFAFLFFVISTAVSWGLEGTAEFMIAEGVLVLGIIIGYIALAALSIVYMVFYYIALYKIFKIFAPENAVIYLILTIFIGIALPIIIFILRNKPVYGYGQGQVPPVGAPGYNPAYGQQSYNPYGYSQYNYTPVGTQAAEQKDDTAVNAETNNASPEAADAQDIAPTSDENNDENI